MEFISQLSSTKSGSGNGLTDENIKWLEKLFKRYSEVLGKGVEISRADFNKIIRSKNQFFTDRVFDIFDKDGSGSISLLEFVESMHQFAGSEGPEDKIRFLFKVYDVDGDGLIQSEELERVIRACMEENGMKFNDDQIKELTMTLFEDADVDKKGALTYAAFKAQLEKHNGLLDNLSSSIQRLLVPPKKEKVVSSFRNKLQQKIPHQLSLSYVKNNYVYVVWLILFLLTNVGLFVSRFILFQQNNPGATIFLVLARAGGQCLNFNCTFIVVVMLRQCLTFLRAKGGGRFLPIDQHIHFHELTGRLIFFFSVFHTVMHLFNIQVGIIQNADQNQSLDDCQMHENVSCPINSQNWTYFHFLFDPAATSQTGVFSLGLIPGYAFNTGVFLIVVLTIMVVCSMSFVRRKGRFEIFYWTHVMYCLFWILLVIHAPNFWKWFLVPGIIFLIEQALRYYHLKVGRGRTCVSSGILLPSKVTHLIIRRPINFEFHPGDYVFVRIPKIAKFEWHPFTISSAPEQDSEIWLHIRAVGEWTTKLYEYFEKQQQELKSVGNDEDGGKNNNRFSRYQSFKRKVRYSAIPQQLNDNLEKMDSEFIEQGLSLHVPTNSIRKKSNSSVQFSASATIINEHGESNDVEFTLADEIPKTHELDQTVQLRKDLTQETPPASKYKSMPNVYERELKQGLTLDLTHANIQIQRSYSTNTISSPSPIERKRFSVSFRNIKDQPPVIDLETPTFEGNQKQVLLRPHRVDDRKSSLKPCDENYNEITKNELKPIFGTAVTASSEQLPIGKPLEIYLDGPYGAPGSQIFHAEHAVLIGTGIGVTPFASILQSIMHRYWASRVCCPNCNFTWCEDLQSVLNLKKVDFFWINRDQRSFEWFVHLLSQLEIEQAELEAQSRAGMKKLAKLCELGGTMDRFLDMHMYITSALQKTDMKAVGLQLALDLLHEKEKRDLITGLKTRTNAGRPNWNKIFKGLSDQRKGKVTVFYCGPPTLASTLKLKCDEFGFSFRKELF